VTIPFQFVIDGQTLPAGTYRVHRFSNSKWQGLIFSNFENRVNVIVHPTNVENTGSETPRLTFETAGDQHFLSQIRTEDSVFNLNLRHQAALLASTPARQGNISGKANGRD